MGRPLAGVPPLCRSKEGKHEVVLPHSHCPPRSVLFRPPQPQTHLGNLASSVLSSCLDSKPVGIGRVKGEGTLYWRDEDGGVLRSEVVGRLLGRRKRGQRLLEWEGLFYFRDGTFTWFKKKGVFSEPREKSPFQYYTPATSFLLQVTWFPTCPSRNILYIHKYIQTFSFLLLFFHQR